MKVYNQYSKFSRFVAYNSGVTHPKLESVKPLSIQEMYNRVLNGLPLSVPLPVHDRIPINDKFFVDGFDVIDLAIKNNFRLEQQERERLNELNAKDKQERQEFEQWKLDQQKEHVKNTSV